MRKLAPVRVLYRDDFLISYRVYMLFTWWLGHFIPRYLKVHYKPVWFKIANITHALPVPVDRQIKTGRSISHRNVWSFRVYMIPLRDFVPEWNSRPGTTTGVNSRRVDSRRHDILWWYHVNKCRAMRGNRSGLAPARKSPRYHVNTLWIVCKKEK